MLINELNELISKAYETNDEVKLLAGRIAELNESQMDLFLNVMNHNIFVFEGFKSNEEVLDLECRTLKYLADAIMMGKDKEFLYDLMVAQNEHNVAIVMTGELIKQIPNVVRQNQFVQGMGENGDKRGYKTDNLPLQGFKFHTSADNIHKLYETYKTLIPEFEHNNIVYKLTLPEYLDTVNESIHAGTLITEYMSKDYIDKATGKISKPIQIEAGTGGLHDLQKLSDDAKYALFGKESNIKALGELSLGGSTTVRYGSYSSHYITGPDGEVMDDTRRKSATPSFMPESELTIGKIFGFYDQIEKDLKNTMDYKSYYEKYFTMLNLDSEKGDPFLIYEMAEDKANVVKTIFSYGNQGMLPDNKFFAPETQPSQNTLDPYKLSFVVKHPHKEGKSLVFVHQSAIPKLHTIKQQALRHGIKENDFVRPAWDKRELFYKVPQHQLEEVAKRLSSAEVMSGNMGLMKPVQFSDGLFGVKVDSCYNRIFEKIMTERNLFFEKTETPKQTPISVLRKIKPPYKELSIADINKLNGEIKKTNTGKVDR